MISVWSGETAKEIKMSWKIIEYGNGGETVLGEYETLEQARDVAQIMGEGREDLAILAPFCGLKPENRISVGTFNPEE
jgi:hypothetical protein